MHNYMGFVEYMKGLPFSLKIKREKRYIQKEAYFHLCICNYERDCIYITIEVHNYTYNCNDQAGMVRVVSGGPIVRPPRC